MFETKKRRMFVMNEKDVTTALVMINGRLHCDSMRVDDCGWADDPDKWFVIFDAKEKTYGKIIKDLQKIGKVGVEVGPDGQVYLRFERA